MTAPEATPGGAVSAGCGCWSGTGSAPTQGNQVSYTLKVYHRPARSRGVPRDRAGEQPQVRCCAVLPSRPDDALGYEYLPEEEVPADRFEALLAAIEDAEAGRRWILAHLQCAGGVCPV